MKVLFGLFLIVTKNDLIFVTFSNKVWLMNQKNSQSFMANVFVGVSEFVNDQCNPKFNAYTIFKG